MSASTRHETTINVPPGLPTIEIVRDFDAPPEKVYRAHVEPDLAMTWMGPRDIASRAEHWDARTGGSWRYVSARGSDEFWFYGSFHELRPGERIVQTFTYEDMPDDVALEIMTFEDLGGGRTRLRAVSIVETLEARDAFVASGMETGVVEGYEQLDELLPSV
ncbi:MAG TPA: SRPBCC family protein [Marmoricola sp.]|nr:SRPBCC family protein [Marmoricola sp.]